MIKNCTGTRIRTQIEGFGDLYTNRCTIPVNLPTREGLLPVFKKLGYS